MLAAHPQVSSEEQRVRGAWSSGVTSDQYTENCPALTLSGALVFADWPDVHAHVYPPRLECLQQFPGVMDAVHCFMDKLYIISVPQLKEGGSLRPFINTCTAVAIMNHPHMENEFGAGNPMVSKMITSALNAKIVPKSAPGTTANAILHHWVKMIRDDFEARNTLQASAEDMSSAQANHQLSIQVQDLAKAVRLEREERIVLTGKVNQQIEENRTLAEENRMLWSSVNELLVKIRKRTFTDSGTAPSTPQSTKRRRVEDGMNAPDDEDTTNVPDEDDDNAAAAASGSPVAGTNPSTAAAVALTLSVDNPMFRAGELRSSKNIHVQTLLKDLFLGGHLASGTSLPNTKLTYIPRENQHQYKGTMELVQRVWTDDQKALLRTPKSKIQSVDASKLQTVLCNIEKQCLQEMATLEKKRLEKRNPS